MLLITSPSRSRWVSLRSPCSFTSINRLSLEITEPCNCSSISVLAYSNILNGRPRMNIYSLQADLCKALSHPTRLQILDLLSERERTVEELIRLLGVGQSNLSQHLAALRQRRLVVARREGANVYYALSSAKIVEACNFTKRLLLELLEREHRVAKIQVAT